LCDKYSLTPPVLDKIIGALGKILGALAVLAFFGGLAWYLYPGGLPSKPLASLSLGELLAGFGWFLFVGGDLFSICQRLQED